MLRCLLLSFAILFFAAGAVAQTDKPRQLTLNKQLVEVSGLAAASNGSVFAHNDEFGIVYEIDVEDGSMARAFALGDPTVAADFEGIAAYDGRIYLITSAGMLYEADISDHRERTRFNVYDTGAGAFCEVEGLSRAPADGAFFILCKRPRKGGPENRLLVYRWSLAERRPVTDPVFSIEFRDFLPGSEREAFRPAGIEWDSAANRILIVSSRSHIVYAFNEDGAFLRKSRLPADIHPQTEGLAVLQSGAVLVADEGGGRGRAGLISVYDELP